MYSSSSNFNPFQYTENPSSIQEDHSSHFFPFPPSSFLDDDEFLLSEFLSQPHQQQQQQILASYTNLEAETPAEMNPAAASKKLAARSNNKKKRSNVNATTKQPVSRKRTGKKDRHSKIHTAQGPRDRRMRLSLQIARKFFDLQDMLGFDKASKTIDWLFTKSKAAIKELAESLPTRVKRSNSSGGGGLSVSSTSESEVIMSGVNKLTHGNEDMREMANEEYFVTNSCRQKKSKKLNKPAFNPLARESRDKARARARERTKEKQKIKGQLLDKSKHSLQENPSNNLDKNQDLGFGSQEMKCNLKIGGDQEEVEEKEENGTSLLPNQMDSVTIVDKFLGLPSVPPKSSSIFDLSQNIFIPSGDNFEDHHEFSGFPGNWEISNGRLVQNRYCAMPNRTVSSIIGNVMNVQNPNAIFITTPPNSQEQNLTSVFMTTQEENPSSVFMNLSNSNKQNPNLIPINTTIDTALHSHHFIEDQFFCNNPKPANNNKYGSLYIN